MDKETSRENRDVPIESADEMQALLNGLSKAVMQQPERMGILFQIIFSMIDGRWDDVKELAYIYGSCLTETNVLGRQLFVNLIVFLRNKELQLQSCKGANSK